MRNHLLYIQNIDYAATKHHLYSHSHRLQLLQRVHGALDVRPDPRDRVPQDERVRRQTLRTRDETDAGDRMAHGLEDLEQRGVGAELGFGDETVECDG